MPLLSVEDLQAMNAEAPKRCQSCGQATRKNYCRLCDVFFEAGHMEACPAVEPDATHQGHRTY